METLKIHNFGGSNLMEDMQQTPTNHPKILGHTIYLPNKLTVFIHLKKNKKLSNGEARRYLRGEKC